MSGYSVENKFWQTRFSILREMNAMRKCTLAVLEKASEALSRYEEAKARFEALCFNFGHINWLEHVQRQWQPSDRVRALAARMDAEKLLCLERKVDLGNHGPFFKFMEDLRVKARKIINSSYQHRSTLEREYWLVVRMSHKCVPSRGYTTGLSPYRPNG